jgi:hypothetical protein
VRDDNSNVQKAEYSLDGDRWQTIYPKDGIPDSRVEQFELVSKATLGSHGVIIRATDALNNMSSARGDVAVTARRAAVKPSMTERRSDVEGASGFGAASTGRGGGAIFAGGRSSAARAEPSRSSARAATPC